MASSPKKRRIFELDLLRGFFIIVIIIDHLQFWPSPLTYITGEGRLWVSAAEGFFLISGLLIGYIRGYKGKHAPLAAISKKLVARAFMLYVWGVAVSLLLIYFTLAVGNHALLPALPSDSQLSSVPTLLFNVLSGNYFNSWIYFLRLYAIMLLATPLFLLLLRKGYEKFVPLLIIAVYACSFVYPEAAFQWQVYFFSAALLGYRLEDVIAWFRSRPTIKRYFSAIILTTTLLSMMLSYHFVFGASTVSNALLIPDPDSFSTLRSSLNSFFSTQFVTIGRILLSFVWFGGLLIAFHHVKPWLLKWLGWLLIPLGEKSLSGYILQALVLPIIVVTIPVFSHSLLNGLFGVLVVLIIWALLKTKIIQKTIPR